MLLHLLNVITNIVKSWNFSDPLQGGLGPLEFYKPHFKKCSKISVFPILPAPPLNHTYTTFYLTNSVALLSEPANNKDLTFSAKHLSYIFQQTQFLP